MVKFTKDCHYYHVVISKLERVLSTPREVEGLLNDRSQAAELSDLETGERDEFSAVRSCSIEAPSRMGSSLNPFTNRLNGKKSILILPLVNSTDLAFSAELSTFMRMLNLSRAEEASFMNATFDIVRKTIHHLQKKQGMDGNLLYMKRLEPFVESMQQFGEAAKRLGEFRKVPQFMAFVWVSPEVGPYHYP